MSLSNNRNA